MSPFERDLKELLTLAWPVVLSRLGHMTMGMVDAIVVGHYSAAEFSHQTLGWAPTGAIVTTAVGLLFGIQVLTARHIGEGRREATGGVFRRGALYAFLVGVLGGLGLALFGPMGLHALPVEESLAVGASKVLTVLAITMPFHLLATASTFYLEALHRPKPAMFAMIGANLVNLVLNLLLVPGAFGFPEWGAVGSAWATGISRVALAVFLLVYIFRMADARALGLFSKPIDGRVAARVQRRIGYGTGASYFVEAGAFTGMGLLAGSIGVAEVAGWGVVLNVTALIFMIPLGLSSATAVLVGRAYGGNDRRGMVRAGNLGFVVTVAVLVVISLAVAIAPQAIARIYTSDAALVQLAAAALLMSAIFFICDGLQVVAAQSLRARGDVMVPTITHVISYAIVMVPLAWWLAIRQDQGLSGIVWAVIVASFLSAGFLLGRFWLLARRG